MNDNTQNAKIADRIRAIAAEVFGLEPNAVDLSMGPDDIDRWDSLNHLRLITEFESSFNLRLAMSQIQQIQTLQALETFASSNNSV